MQNNLIDMCGYAALELQNPDLKLWAKYLLNFGNLTETIARMGKRPGPPRKFHLFQAYFCKTARAFALPFSLLAPPGASLGLLRAFYWRLRSTQRTPGPFRGARD